MLSWKNFLERLEMKISTGIFLDMYFYYIAQIDFTEISMI